MCNRRHYTPLATSNSILPRFRWHRTHSSPKILLAAFLVFRDSVIYYWILHYSGWYYGEKKGLFIIQFIIEIIHNWFTTKKETITVLSGAYGFQRQHKGQSFYQCDFQYCSPITYYNQLIISPGCKGHIFKFSTTKNKRKQILGVNIDTYFTTGHQLSHHYILD